MKRVILASAIALAVGGYADVWADENVGDPTAIDNSTPDIDNSIDQSGAMDSFNTDSFNRWTDQVNVANSTLRAVVAGASIKGGVRSSNVDLSGGDNLIEGSYGSASGIVQASQNSGAHSIVQTNITVQSNMSANQ